jgi:hypothetical protein
MKRSKVIFVLIVLFFSCTNNSPRIQTKITKDSNNQTIELKINEQFDAGFNECIGCSDIWEISKIDSTKVQYLEKKYSNKSCQFCVGGNQDVTFKFKAIKYGESEMSFHYFGDTVKVKLNVK